MLIIVATVGEAARLDGLSCPGLDAVVVVSGVGPVASALATARALSGGPFGLAVSAGIGGAYPASGLHPGDLALSSEIIQADLGAWDGGTWLGLDDLGLSVLPEGAHFARFSPWGGARVVAERLGAAYGPLLTLSSVTGDHATAWALEARHPGALTEGMEGAGVAHAALLAGVSVVEVRGVSNLVGPRDRAAWRIAEALDATRRGLDSVLAELAARAD